MNEKKRLLKNTGLIAIGNFGVKMISFLLLPLYTSILTTDEYGTYDFIVAISAFLLPIVTGAMHEAMFRFIIDTGKEGKEFNRIITNAFFSVVLGISFLGVIFIILKMSIDPANILYIWLFTGASALYTFSNNLLRGLGRIKEYAVISSCKNILQLILNVLVVAVFKWGMQGLLFSMCISETLAFAVTFSIVHLWKYINLRYLSTKKLKEMLSYSIPLIPNALCAQIINVSDRIIISGCMGTSANGIYSISYKFPNMIETVYHYFYTAWSESASRVISQGKKEAEKYYQTLYEVVDKFIFSVVLLMISGMPLMFRVFVRGDYMGGFVYVPLLMFAMYFDSVSKFFAGIFTALKITNVMAWTTIIAAVTNLIINFYLIKYIGLYAAAGSTFIADLLLMILRKKKLDKHIQIKIAKKDSVIKLLVAVIVILLYDFNNWLNIIAGLMISFIYAIISNRKIIISLVEKIKK